MIGTKLRALAVSAALAVAAVPAYAVTVTPFDTPLNAGDATLGNAVASANEDFGMTTLSFDAAEDLFADISITINPFLLSPGGIVSNSISLAYQVNGGSAIAVAV